MEIKLSDEQERLLRLASSVTGESVQDFIVRSAIEEADCFAHMSSESWDQFGNIAELTSGRKGDIL